MNWIDIVWPMMAAASLTLAVIHLLIWLKQRNQTAHSMVALTAVSAAAIAIFELLGMHAPTLEQYSILLFWGQLPVALWMIGTVSYVRLRLNVGRRWLATLVCVVGVASLLPDFLTGVNLNVLEMAALLRLPVFGGDLSAVAPGVSNPWLMLLGELPIVLLLSFLLDAIVSRWRRGPIAERRRVTLVCGSLFVFVVVCAAWGLAIGRGWLALPLTLNPGFMLVLLVMSYELGGDILRSAQLARKLRISQSNLRETEQSMQLAVDAADMGLWEWDIQTGNVWLSERCKGLLGFSAGERVDRRRFLARVHTADRRVLRNALSAAAHAGGDYRSEFRIASPQGNTWWIVARGRADFAGSGAPLRLRGVLVDITERKTSDERFRLVVETSPTAMLMVDAGGDIVLVNRQAEIAFGYPREEMLGMSVERLVPQRSRDRHAVDRSLYAAEASARLMGAGRELFALRRDGTEIPVEIALSPIRSGGGVLVLVAVADISERKRSERELLVQRDELAHLSRVVMLAELSGSLAHELNQPLTAILSNAQAAVRFLAQAPPNLVEVRDSLTNIIENDKRAGEVIRRLRSMLRKERADYRRLEINEVVLDVLRIIRSDLLNRNVDTVLDLAPLLPPIDGDRVQLQQVLLNLVMNAADAMAGVEEDREITLRTRTTSRGVEVSVEDVGRGVPDTDLDLIFSPFVTTKPNGMGLGLAVCSSIVQAHSGAIWATNNAGRGAAFHFRLPAIDGAVDISLEGPKGFGESQPIDTNDTAEGRQRTVAPS